MEVATLTATLEAEVTRFVANMKAADQLLTSLQKQIKETEGDSEELSSALRLIKVSERAIADSIKQLTKLNTGMETSHKQALDLTGALGDLSVPESAAAKSDMVLGQIDNQLDETKRKAIETKAALGDLGGVTPGFIRAYGPNWGRRAFIAPPVGGYSAPQLQPTNYAGGAELVPYAFSKAARDILVADRIFQNDLAGRYQLHTPGMGPMTYEQYQASLAERGFKPYGKVFGANELPPNPRYNFPATGRGDVSGAKRYLRSMGINWDDTALGGAGGVRRSGADAMGVAAALGWSGRGSHWTRLGFGGRGFGFGIPVPPHAAFGTPLALAGFGLDRMIASTLGILGSFGGGILGGGILGAGALGTMAVGAGTNLAGIGQASGDIHTVTTDLNNLQSAISQYGKNSIQAADAQAQLNFDLKSFSPVARNAVLAASQTAQGFKTMFDKVTGQAEKTGAEIIQQAMLVGEKFLPTIGKFAAQNMHILQQGLQPLFGWLTRGGNAQNVVRDVNNLNKAIKEHGAHSMQAAKANQQLNKDSQKTGGLGYFQDLEKIFQQHFPTAIHAGEQGFELFIKTIDLAAQHLGHFLQTVNNFFTKMNNQDFGKWAVGVEHLIGLFHAWLGMFVSFGKVIYDLLKPTVGLGEAFAKEMSAIFNQIGKYLNQKGTQNILNQLFSVHLWQLIKQIGGLVMNLLPLVEGVASAWLQMEIVAARALGGVISLLRTLIGWINKIPGADKFLGWIIAGGTFLTINKLLLGSLFSLVKSIPIIGGVFAAVGTLIKSLMGIGPAAAAGAAEADAALTSVAGAATVATGGVTELESGLLVVGETGVVAGAEAAGGFAAIAAAATAALAPIIAVTAAIGAAYLGYKIFTSANSQPNRTLSKNEVVIDGHKELIRRNGKWYYNTRFGLRPASAADAAAANAAEVENSRSSRQADAARSELLGISGAYQARRRREHKDHEQALKVRKQMEDLYKSLGIPYHLVKGVPTPSNVTTPTTPGATPTGYLNKQQAMTSQARIDIANGQNAAAIKLLKLEQQQLEAMLKTAKTQAERTAILSQLATVAGLIQSTKKTAGVNVAGGQTFQLPLAIQVAIARADALAALNPNLQGPTSQQYKLALKAKQIAMKAIDSHTLSMQQLIQAWQIVQQSNSVIAQRMGVFANTYHAVSTDAITDAVKGLTRAQEMQLRERMAQRDAHRGYAPNQSAVGGAGSTAASPHHRHHRHHGGSGGAGGGGVRTESAYGGTSIHIDKVEIHGVQNVRQLAAEIKSLGRQTYQRAGARR